MKKKFYSLLAIIFFMFTCVFTSACGDKYKKMEFRISYAFSEDAKEWFDGTNGISLNYGGKFDSFKIEEGCTNLYLKIDILNVKAKDLDKITVSPKSFAGLQFSSATVKEKEVFALPIAGVVDTTLKLYENNSRKSYDVDLKVYRSLEKIDVDASIKPALINKVGSTLNLNLVNNLIYNPYPLEATNQEGVKYNVESIGAYTNEKIFIVSKNATEALTYVDINDGILNIKNSTFLNSSSTVIRVKATSIYHDGSINKEDVVTATFDVYVAPANTVSPVLKYNDETGKTLNTTTVIAAPHVNIYENGGLKYSTSTLYVDAQDLTGPYLTGVNTQDGMIYYSIAVFVKNARGEYQRYLVGDANYQSGINGLIITASDNNKYTFSIANRLVANNMVKFAYVLDGLDFSASKEPDISSEIKVSKSVLPTVLTANNTVDLKNGDTQNGIIYGTQSATYKGLELKFTANPNDDPSKIIEFYPEAGLLLTDGKEVLTSTKVITGETVFVKFKDNTIEEQTLTVRTLKTPEYYNGETVKKDDEEYITVTYYLEKKVTADAIDFVSATHEIVENFRIDAENGSSLYAKIYFTGTALDRSTIKIESDNSNILFANDSQTITLDDVNISKFGFGSDNNGRYDIYKIPMKANNKVADAKITIIAGEGVVNIKKDLNVSSVYLMNPEALEGVKVVATNETVKTFGDANNFAIAKNQFAEFAVYDGFGVANTINNISFMTIDKEGLNSASVTPIKVASNEFTVTGNKIGTKLFNIVITYYAEDINGNIVENSKDIPVQIAVYDAIGNVNTDDYNNLIAYVNNYFTDSASSEIEFEALTAIYGTPASEIKLLQDVENNIFVTEKGASQLQVSIDSFNTIKSSGKISIKFVSKEGVEIDLLQNAKTVLQNGDNYYLNGKIVVELLEKVEDIKNINITIQALRFGIPTSAVANISLNLAEVNKAAGIIVTGNNFTQLNDDIVELRVNFMNTQTGGYEDEEFNASIRFNKETNLQNVLTFKDIESSLTYMVYKYDFVNDVWTRYFDDFFSVTFADNKVKIRAYKDNGGGYFKFVLATKDSFISNKDPFKTIVEESDFSNTYTINVRVSDGTIGAEYVVESVDDLKLINNNLNSHFVLGNNIVVNENLNPIGWVNGELKTFNGTLNGKLDNDIADTNYSITFTVNNTVISTENGYLAGLFAVLGTNAKVSNLTLNVKYAEEFTSDNHNGLKIGAVAGVNNGVIENVKINLAKAGTVAFKNITTGKVNFAGVVGLNNATISGACVNFDNGLTINSTTTVAINIGLIAATNNGTITGNYLGKESLNNYVFDVVANMIISGQNEFSIGVVAGENNNTIKNMLVGGKVDLVNTAGQSTQRGCLAGIAGKSIGGTISCVTAMSLNLTATAQDVTVAGVVGNASNTNIDHAKFVSANTIFDSFEAQGKIVGKTAAGIVASLNGGKIEASSVESFINTFIDNTDANTLKTFFTLEGVTVYGIANATDVEIVKCFVNANLKGTDIVLTTNLTENNTSYFIGDVTGSYTSNAKYNIVNSNITVENYVTATTINAESDLTDVYIKENDVNYIKAEKYDADKTYVKFNHAAWQTYANGLVDANNNWKLEENHNFIFVYGVKFYFPYLVEGEEAIMIVAPESIEACVNETYETIIDYIRQFDIEDYDVKEVIYVNYFNKGGDENNAHILISGKNADGTSKNDGLLNADILPSDAQGGFAYNIIGDGYKYAYINDINKIVFTGVSSQTPILVRIYSIFNPDIEVYVVFYSQSGVTKLNLKSTVLYAVNSENYQYETSLYTGQANKVVGITAENKINGTSNLNILDVYDVQQYLKVETTSNKEDKSKINIDVASYKNITMKIKDGEIVTVGETEIITFKLFLDKAYFLTTGLELAEDVEIGEVKLLVYLYNAASNIEIVGSDKELTTSSDLNFHIYLTTEFVGESKDETVVKIAEVNDAGDIILQDDANNDSIKITLDIVEGDNQITALKQQINENKEIDENDIVHFAEMFEVTIIRTLYKDNSGNIIGFIYNVTLQLKDDHYYRFTTENIKYNIIVSAISNEECNNQNSPMEVLLKPTSVSTAKLEVYAVNSLRVNSSYTTIVESKDIESSIIEPGGLGNIMMIYLEPTYSNVVSAKIKTSSLPVPSLGKNVQIKFTQLVYNQAVSSFTTLYSSKPNVQQDDTLELQLISEIDTTNKEIYTGVILVYMQLERFAGLEDTINVTLDVETNNGVTMQRYRNLLTTYLPGTSIEFDESKKIDANEYLIQKGTSENEVKIKVYGYQFNSNPEISFSWDKDSVDGSAEYKYINSKTLESGGDKLYIGNYISYNLLNSYNEVVYDEDDRSYTITLKLNVAEDIPAAFKVSATLSLATTDGQLYTSSDENNTITFHPIDYVINSVYVANLSNNKKNIAVNKSNSIDVRFTTDNHNLDLSETIYENLLETYEYNLLNLFKYYKNGEHKTFADTHSEFSSVMVNNEIVSITGISKFSAVVTLSISYQYKEDVNGLYKVVFGSGYKLVDFTFTLEIFISDEANERPIYSAEELYNSSSKTWNLDPGGYYVLMNDIELENVAPITTQIGSFDGNNRTISIKSFATNISKGNYGLFASIGQYQTIDSESGLEVTKQTILKNMIVDYSKFDGTLAVNTDSTTSITFGGLVAENNGGLIYNCDVMNLNAGKDAQIDVIVAKNANVTFGGLVGNNAGVITNSRVGRDKYSRITATKTTESEQTKYAGGLTFSVYNKEFEANDNNQFNIVAGGFVGENSGTIAASYVAKTNLINYSTIESAKTAGFVGNNTGSITYSYAKASEDSLSSSNAYSIGYAIENKGNGIVAGFVYSNSGIINNSYANLELKTLSAYVSGFVYNNSGSISESYAAATMSSGNSNSNAKQPFIGVNELKELMNTGSIKNSYYLMRSNTDLPYYYKDRDVAQGLNIENFKNSENLTGFVFVLSNSIQERQEGVWSYYTTNNQFRILPELMNTNTIAHSYRYVSDDSSATKVYTNAVRYAQGTKNNPYVIASVKDYNNVFTENNTNSKSGYIRFINNIDFHEDKTAIKTRVNYTLGNNDDLSTMTSVEGNGMTIKGIYLDVGEAIVDKIGLFASIENTYVKNLNLQFATPSTNGQFSTTTVPYSGGLAGTIVNSVVINVKLEGNTTLTGSNYVGGLAGVITGDSLIYGIETNLNVKASSVNSNLYYSEQDYITLNRQLSTHLSYRDYVETLSYAGGVAGVIDLTPRKNIDFNVQYIDVRGDKMQSNVVAGEKSANILAEYAGGIAGYAGKNTNSFKLRYFTGNAELIRGNTAVGGLYGVAMGRIVASQVTADEKIQYSYDTSVGKYIIDLAKKAAGTLTQDVEIDKAAIGNTSLIEGYNYAGGLIGLALNSSVESCYTKVGIKAGKTVGGLLGVSVASNIEYSYSIPFINSTTIMRYVGGLIGSAYAIDSTTNSEIAEYDALLKQNNVKNDTTDIKFTYSTLILDSKAKYTTNMDYVVANFKNTQGQTNLTSDKALAFVKVFAGEVDYNTFNVTNNTQATNNASVLKLHRLFDVGNADQSVAFQEVFAGWSVIPHWSLKETKYFPLLNNEAVDNFIDIDDESDFYQLSANHEGKFRIIKDITINARNANWIVTGMFKGVLIGDIEGEDRSPRVTIQGLQPNRADTTGFFQETYGATITDIDFVWEDEAINITRDGITIVSGLTCKDTGSLISNIDVRVNENSAGGQILSLSEGKTITGFGGVVGVGTNTNMLACRFIGKVTATVKGSEVFVGGLIANGESATGPNKQKNSENSEIKNTTVINSSYVGAVNPTERLDNSSTISYPTTEFNITVEENSIAYIGGVVGKAKSTAIASNKVGGTNYHKNYQTIKFDIALNNASNVYFGGVVGHATDGSIQNCEAKTVTTLTGTISEIDNYDTEGEPSETTGRFINVGGLAGLYDLDLNELSTGIFYSNADVNISTFVEDSKKLTLNTNDQLRVSAGIAELGSNATMQQCLFVGEINTEESVVTNVLAGGAVAKTTSDSGEEVDIDQIMTNVNMIVGSTDTNSIYAGGLIGLLDKAKISYCSSLGRVVPITSENANNIYGGGLIGKVEDGVNINNCYTISSIIADSIAGKALNDLHMGALIGDIPTGSTNTNVDNTFYSSDYALFADENYVDGSPLGTNIAAATMLNNKVWHENLMSEDGLKNNIWTSNSNTGSNVPYLTSLETSLISFGVLNYQIGSGNYAYIVGSAMNPIQIVTGTKYVLPEDEDVFNYYLLSTKAAIAGTLRGVLIGHDTFNITTEITTTILEEIAQHSAVSNLHIKLEKPSITDMAETAGIIANVNNGVIFNSSVVGYGITIESATSFGLIAGENKGLISYSYSTAEVVSTSASTAGIVHTNKGKLLSNYFTGFIETADNNLFLAGIVVALGDGQYAYNNYMAGVIIGGTGANNFSANANLVGANADLVGENNFIDKYSDLDYTITTGVLISIETVNLMSKERLNGEWYFTMNENGYKEDGNPTFGYNYNYPIYRFNKATFKGTVAVVNEWDQQLETGTGGSEEFKIPHLGVLSTLASIADDDRSFVVIYDLDGINNEDESLKWEAIGGTFSGTFKTNRYYETKTDGSLHIDENHPVICTIQNLKDNGLFAEIKKATFENINLGSFYNLQESGALGKTILFEESSPEDYVVTVDNITFLLGSTVSGVDNNTNYYGGLFGKVNGQLTVNKFVSVCEDDFGNNISSITMQSNNATVGLIAGQSSGKIILDNASEDSKKSYYYVFFNGNGYAGGIVGEMAGGSIEAKDNTINIVGGSNTEFTSMIGGIVAKTSDDCIISNAVVNLYAPGQNEVQFTTNSFGGFVGKVEGITTVTNCQIAASNEEVLMIAEANQDNYFGLFAGDLVGTLTVNGFTKDSEKLKTLKILARKNTDCFEDDKDNSGVGVFVGKIKKDSKLEINSYTTFDIQIAVTGVPNLGGIAGYYGGGKVVLYNTPIKTEGVVLNGTTNVGGLFGWASSEVTEETFKTTASGTATVTETDAESGIGTQNKNINLLTNNGFATINIGQEGISDNKLKNFGGLFGKYSAGNLESAINGNKFILTKGTEAYNVGGIAGLFTGESASGLKNGGNTAVDSTNSINTNNNINEDEFNVDLYNANSKIVQTVNVGGVFGLVDIEADAALNNLINTANIIGYQNVGGLIGYVAGAQSNSVTIVNDKSINLIEDESTNKPKGLVWDNSNGTLTNLAAIDEEPGLGEATKGKIYGVLNVGGAIGYAGERVTVSQIYSGASVYGNASVGGLVGYAHNATLTNNYIAQDENESDNTNTPVVKGIYYNYKYIENYATGKQVRASYIPTSVGGFVGSVQGAILTNNIVNSVQIISSDEGMQGDVISTISNYMVNFSVGEANNNSQITSPSDIYELTNTNNKTEFNNISTGFGGFIGSTNVEYNTSNVLKNITVNAQLGINVGTYYGVIADRKNANGLTVPMLYDDVDVDGAYNIGGLVGYVVGTASGITNENLAGDGTINLQSNIVGMYVGGLIGKTSNNTVTGLKITANGSPKIVIHTDNSYYIGGLIGRAEADGNASISGDVGNWNLNNNNTPSDNADDKYVLETDSDNIINGHKTTDSIDVTYESVSSKVGGLIGMLKVAKTIESDATKGGLTIDVDGNHNFAFTVNTVENSNYFDGGSIYDVEDSSNIMLSATAYYINMDTFNIVGSKNESLYDNESDVNPLRKEVNGWSKQYTVFKQMNRCIPLEDNNGAEWDSIALVYDAYNITNVGTIKNLELTNAALLTDNGTKIFDPDYICYTVYEEEEDEPTLYSSIGIADMLVKEEEVEVDGETVVKRSYTTPEDNNPSAWDWVSGFINTERPETSLVISIRNNGNLKGLTYFDHKGSYKTIGDENGTTQNTTYQTPSSQDKTKVEVVYDVTNYMPDDNNNTQAYFKFTTIFDNASANDNGLYQLPNSGSVFEMCGFTSSVSTQANKTNSGWGAFEVASVVVSVAAEIALAYFTAGTGNAALQAGKGLLKGAQLANKAAKAAKAIKFLDKIKDIGTASLKLAKVAIHGFALMTAMNVFMMQNAGAESAKITWQEQRDGNFGLYSSAYTKEISYTNGKLNDASDVTIIVDDQAYVFCSNIRPSDWYTGYYLGLRLVDESVNDDAETSLSTSDRKTFDINTATKIDEKDKTILLHATENYILVPQYIYYQGDYYINTLAGDVVDYQIQNFIKDYRITGTERVEGYYADFNGKKYVYGKFDGTNQDEPYKIGANKIGANDTTSDYPTNRLKYKDGNYYVNNKLFTGTATYTPSEPYKYTESTFGSEALKNLGYTLGYTYFDTVYYTAKGGYTDLTKNASFIYDEEATEAMVDNINYIKVQAIKGEETYISGYDEDGKTPIYATRPTYTTLIYKFNGLGDETNAFNKDVWNSDKTTIDITDETYEPYEPINVIIYADCFVNPYDFGNAISTNTCFTYSKDATEKFITAKPTYYYFEGGYEMLKITESDGDYSATVVNEFTRGETALYLAVDKGEYNNLKLGIKGENGTIETKTYAEYVTANPNKEGLFENYVTETECQSYYIKDGIIYKRVSGNMFVNEHGLLSNSYVNYPLQGKVNYNKYLTNEEWGIYTKFKYNNDRAYGIIESNLEGFWPKAKAVTKSDDLYSLGGSNYRLIPANKSATSPNNKPTYLTERCQVTLGGGQFNYRSGARTEENLKAGLIKVK